jgi:hypothetical protein
VSGIDVELPDAELAHVAYVQKGFTGAAGCTTDPYFWIESIGTELIGTEGSGVVRLRDVSIVDGRQVACKVKLNAEIEGISFHETVEIWDPDCPTPAPGGEKKRTYRSLTAAMSSGLLRILAWDSETSTCAVVYFDVYGGENPQSLVAPDDWRFIAGSLVHMDDAAGCSEEGSGDSSGYEFAESITETASGELTFLTSEASDVINSTTRIPCRLALKMSMEFRDEYHWVPRVVKLVDDDVVVDGACD